MRFTKMLCPYCNGFGKIEKLELRLGADNAVNEIKVSEVCPHCLGKGIIEGEDKLLLPRPGAILYRVIKKEGEEPPN